MAPMKKGVEEEGGKKKKMIAVEVKQMLLDRFLVKAAQKTKKSEQIAVIPLVTMKVVLPNN
jgi:hypothetical protein